MMRFRMPAARPADPGDDAPRGLCERRGYCGPFVNQAYFNSLEAWAGFGICVECGCTVPVPHGERSFAALDRLSELHTPAPRPAI